MKRIYVFIIIVLVLGCKSNTRIYKQDEVVSNNVYALRDSVTAGRYDLVESYIDQVTRLIVPPQDFVNVSPLQDSENKHIVLIPERFKDSNIVLVGSDAYDKLKKLQNIAQVLATENESLKQTNARTEKALRDKEKAVDSLSSERDSLKEDKSKLETTVSNQTSSLIKKNLTIVGLILLIIAYLYVKKVYKLPI